MRRKFHRLLFWGLAAGAQMLAGCGDLVTSTRHAPGYTGNMVLNYLDSAGAQGPVLVRVVNNPFGGGPLDRMVADEATQASRLPAVRFTSNAAEAKQPGWQVVFVFNPGPGANVRDACENAGAIQAVAMTSESQVIASFCNGTRMIAGVRAYTGTVASASDPRLKQLVRRAVLDLFGQGDTDDGDGLFFNSSRPSGLTSGYSG